MKMQIGTRVRLKRRTQDLGLTKTFSRVLGETWSRDTIAYIVGFDVDPAGKKIVQIMTPVGNHQIDVYEEHVSMSTCQPRISANRYRKARKPKISKDHLEEIKSLYGVETSSDDPVDTTEKVNLVTIDKIEPVASAETTPTKKARKAVETIEDAPKEDSATKERNRAKHLVELIKERKIGLKNNKVTEPTLTRLGQKFRDRNHKLRVITLMNNILNPKLSKVVIEKLPRKKTPKVVKKDEKKIAKILFEQIMDEKAVTEKTVTVKLISLLNSKLPAPYVFDKNEKRRLVTLVKKLIEKHRDDFNFTDLLSTTVEDVNGRTK